MTHQVSYVVTGGTGGVGRAIVERLAREGAVVVIDPVEGKNAGEQITSVVGDARDPEVTDRAAALAEGRGCLAGWVNNAAIFQDASLDAKPAPRILELISANLALAISGLPWRKQRHGSKGGIGPADLDAPSRMCDRTGDVWHGEAGEKRGPTDPPRRVFARSAGLP